MSSQFTTVILKVKNKITSSLHNHNRKVKVEDHYFPGQYLDNICNQGLAGKDIQH